MESFMRLKKLSNRLVLDLIGDDINQTEFDVHLKSIKGLKRFKELYVNIANLENINNSVISKFIKMRTSLSDKEISFINVNPVQNALLNIFQIDKMFQIYMNKADAFAGKKPVINRKFRIV